MDKNTKYQILNTEYHSGFMLIEALTLLFIFSLILVTFYSVFSVGLHYIQDSKNRLGALAVANEKMEIIRNLSYDSVGTVSGTIEGDIPQDEDISENAHAYHVHTEVIYVDDPFDGSGASDAVWFEDYKKVTVIVSWGTAPSEQVTLSSRFVPSGLEVSHVGDGILTVNVFSDQPGGSGIPNSKVQIYNPETGLNTYSMTDASGSVVFMGDNVTDSIQKYQIVVTKSGYETVATMPPYPDTPYEPVDIHASVVSGSMNVKNIVQNELANIRISTVDHLDQPVVNAHFHLVGGRRLGNDTSVIPSIPIYNFDEDGETGSDGEKEYDAISPGAYVFSLVGSTADDYEIIGADPDTAFHLMSADGTLDVKVKLASKSVSAFLATVLDGDSMMPIPGATVKLTNTAIGYDKELVTGNDGKAYFPDSADPFVPGTYHLKITADGFQDAESDIVVNTGELKAETVNMSGS